MVARLIERVWGDFRLGGRRALQSPLATFIIVVTLALGIAATSVAFSAMNALFIRPLDVHDAARIVRVYHFRERNGQHLALSYAEVGELRQLPDVFAGVAGEYPTPLSLGVDGKYERIWGEMVSEAYFSLLGVTPAAGRFFSEHEERLGEPVVVLGHGLWLRRFGGSHEALGSTIHVDGHAYRIVGVAPSTFRGTLLSFTSDLWIPTRAVLDREDERSDRAFRAYFTVARLAPNVSIGHARTALESFATRLEHDYPESNRGVRFAAFPESTGRVPPPFHDNVLGFSVVGIAAALLVTVVACANVAGVLLARLLHRASEIGVRLALGASRARIIAQLMIEAATLSIAAGALGMVAAWQATEAIGALRIPLARGAVLSLDTPLDVRVLSVSLLCTALTVVFCGISPAFAASRSDVVTSLKSGRGGGVGTAKTRTLFMLSQVAVATVLVVGTGVFVRSLQNARQVNLGFDPQGVVTTAVDVRARGTRGAEVADFWVQLLSQVRVLPLTESASLTARLPLEFGIMQISVAADGADRLDGTAWLQSEFAVVEPDYFKTLRIALVEGRDFTERDTTAAPQVVVVNDVLARHLWPRQSGVGEYMVGPGDERYQVVGVVRRSKYLSIGENPKPYAYFPLRQGASRAMTIVARSRGDAPTLLSAVQDTVQRLDPTATLYDVGTMADRVELALAPTTGGAAVFGGVGLTALVLTALGLFGTVSQTVSRRTFEIGVRRALGAQGVDVARLVIGDVMKAVVAGLVIGLGAATVAAGLMQALLFDVDRLDPVVFAMAGVVLFFACLLAAWVPVARATRINPAAALRSE